MTLSLEDTGQLIGFGDGNQADVLKALYKSQEKPLSAETLYEFRFLLSMIRIILNIKDNATRCLVRNLISVFLREQFKGKSNLDCKSLQYLFPMVWHFRNCRSLGEAWVVGNDPAFISSFRKRLTEAGIAVQLEMELEV